MIGRAALLVGSLLFSPLVLELGCRLWRGPREVLHWPNLAMERLREVAEGQDHTYRHDVLLGWTPTLNFSPTYSR